jgi:hypothetical protein
MIAMRWTFDRPLKKSCRPPLFTAEKFSPLGRNRRALVQPSGLPWIDNALYRTTIQPRQYPRFDHLHGVLRLRSWRRLEIPFKRVSAMLVQNRRYRKLSIVCRSSWCTWLPAGTFDAISRPTIETVPSEIETSGKGSKHLIPSQIEAAEGIGWPFYLQPTLGGTDINNFDVLRSYHDYRFRAPDALFFQAEYTRTIWAPLGALVFYDVGKMALVSSDLGISHMRHSCGAGFTVRAGNATLFKLYYAWAGSEGTHTTYTGNTNNFAADPNLRGVF